MTWVPGAAASAAASSAAAWPSRRSGQSARSSGMVKAGRQPALPELRRLRAVQAEVHRAQRGRVQALGVPDRGDGGQVVAVDQEQDDAPGVVRRMRVQVVAGVFQDGRLLAVLPVEADQRVHEHREDDHDQPRALGELHHREQHHDEGGIGPARLGDPRAEILPGHHVGAARPGVHRHHLAVRQHDQHDAEQDEQGHRQHQREGGQAEEREQRAQDLLGAVGRR